MLGHISIRVLDPEASVKFHLEALSTISYTAMRFPEVTGIRPSESSVPIPCLWIRKYAPKAESNDAQKPSPVPFSLYVQSRQQVDEFYASGIKASGKDNEAPRLRPFTPDYYAAYLLDLDGNKIKTVCLQKK